MYSIKKKFTFECAHVLGHLKYDSPCKNIHGHSYKVFLTIKTKKLNEDGMVIDFTKLKEFKSFIDNTYDHAIVVYNNDDLVNFLIKNKYRILIYDKPTTAENMAFKLCDYAFDLFDFRLKPLDLQEITVDVYETENNCASYTLTLEDIKSPYKPLS